MNKSVLVVLLVVLFGFSSASLANSELQLCRQDCLAQKLHGYEMKACLYDCEKQIEKPNSKKQDLFMPTYCNTDEPDCERDDGEYDGSGWSSGLPTM